MARELSPEVETALDAGHVPYMLFVQIDTDPVLRLCNAGYTIPWDGHDWLGAGRIGSISPIEEGASVQMYGISLQLTGIPAESISLALAGTTRGKAVTIWMAPLDGDHQILADPIQVFGGIADVTEIEIGETATITVSAESQLIEWDRAPVGRYTDEDQQQRFPGDRGLEFVSRTTEMDIDWGIG